MTPETILALARAIHGTPHATRASFSPSTWAGVERAWEWIGKNYQPKDESVFLNEYQARLERQLSMNQDDRVWQGPTSMTMEPPMKQENDLGDNDVWQAPTTDSMEHSGDAFPYMTAHVKPWTAEQREAACDVRAACWMKEDGDAPELCAAIAKVAPLFVSPPPVPSVEPPTPAPYREAVPWGSMLIKARKELDRLCQDTRGWRMSIPADHTRDSDLIFDDALRCAENEIRARDERIAVLEKELADIARIAKEAWPEMPEDREGALRRVCALATRYGWIWDARALNLATIATLEAERARLREVLEEVLACIKLDPTMDGSIRPRGFAVEIIEAIRTARTAIATLTKERDQWKREAVGDSHVCSHDGGFDDGWAKGVVRGHADAAATIATLTKERDEARAKPRSVTMEELSGAMADVFGSYHRRTIERTDMENAILRHLCS